MSTPFFHFLKHKTLALALAPLVLFQHISKFCNLCIQNLFRFLLFLICSTAAIPEFFPWFPTLLKELPTSTHTFQLFSLYQESAYFIFSIGKSYHTFARNPETGLWLCTLNHRVWVPRSNIILSVSLRVHRDEVNICTGRPRKAGCSP